MTTEQEQSHDDLSNSSLQQPPSQTASVPPTPLTPPTQGSQRFTFFIVRPRGENDASQEDAPVIIMAMGDGSERQMRDGEMRDSQMRDNQSPSEEDRQIPSEEGRQGPSSLDESPSQMLVYLVRRDGTITRSNEEASHDPTNDRFLQFLLSLLNPLSSYEDLLNLDTLFGIQPRGVSQALIDEQLKSHLYTASSDTSCCCRICLDSFVENEEMRTLPCDHFYHKSCIDMWLTGHRNNCPLCRQECVRRV